MKKTIIIISSLVLLLLLFPFPSKMRDGGTTHYNAILYDVYDIHRLKPVDDPSDDGDCDTEYIEGVIVEVLGFSVFNNTDPHIER